MPEMDFRGTMSKLSVSLTPTRLSVSPKIAKSLVCSVMGQSSSEPGLRPESGPRPKRRSSRPESQAAACSRARLAISSR
ncbi:MAG: hypothetical protein MZU79_07160 [Anaerotruncus sp.]|nr:hypothetical protein [Anaerotruncus sp.]